MCQGLAKLALFDIILFVDNSATMALEEDGERLIKLHTVLFFVVQVVSLFVNDGVTLQFVNARSGNRPPENVKDITRVKQYLKPSGLFHGTTPLGTQFQQQILNATVTKA